MSVNNSIKKSKIFSIKGGGEMGQLIRAYDWSQTVLGDSENWSVSLLTSIKIILNSRFPMFIWWGRELIQFYNDAYRICLGEDGKHPKALGQKGIDCWPEIWDTIKPLIDQVMAGGESIWSDDQLIPIYRNGRMEDVYWTFSYSRIEDESEISSGGVLVICTETTEKVKSRQQILESYKIQDNLNIELNNTVKSLALANNELALKIEELSQTQYKLRKLVLEIIETEVLLRNYAEQTSTNSVVLKIQK